MLRPKLSIGVALAIGCLNSSLAPTTSVLMGADPACGLKAIDTITLLTVNCSVLDPDGSSCYTQFSDPAPQTCTTVNVPDCGYCSMIDQYGNPHREWFVNERTDGVCRTVSGQKVCQTDGSPTIRTDYEADTVFESGIDCDRCPEG